MRSGAVRRSYRGWKGVAFRASAVFIGLLPLLIGELACRMFGWGSPRLTRDPMVGLEPGQPLFELDPPESQSRQVSGAPQESQTQPELRYRISSRRLAYFSPDSFAAHKPANEFRIFCLGGSTVQGRPYAKETAFSTWLELSLQAADSQRAWRVVNCGGVSYASYRLVPILEEVLRYEPDLIIVYTGHNEFLEDRTYARLKDLPTFVRRGYGLLRHSRLFGAALQLAGHSADTNAERPLLPAEVDALLDYRGGLESYRRDDAWRQDVGQHFELNLQRMALLCQASHVPLLLVDPVCNLKDCPPFKVETDPQLNDANRRQFDLLLQRAMRSDVSLTDQLELLEQAAAIDPRHAGIRYQLGKAYEALNRSDDARRELLRAKDEDLCPLRMPEALHERLHRVAARNRLPLVDARRQFEQVSPQSLVGDEWLLDHVHPTIEGHQRIASMLVEEMRRQGWLTSADAGWQERRDQRYRRHLPFTSSNEC